MKSGISTASLFSRMNNEDAISFFNKEKINTAEVFLTSFCEYDKDFGHIINKNKGNVQIHSMHVLNTQFEPQLFSDNIRVKNDAYQWLKKAMEAGNAFGAKNYTFHGIARVKKDVRERRIDPVDKWGEDFLEIYNFCIKYGIRLCLENVEWSSYNRPGVFKEIKKRCPSLGGVIDIKQARRSCYPLWTYINEMGDSIAHAHISDIDENGKICLPGTGVFDFDEFLKRLNGVGFNGALIIEVYNNDYNDIKELKKSCEYIDELLYKYSFNDKYV